MTNLSEEEQDREQCRLEEDTTEEILGAGGLRQGAQGRDRIDSETLPIPEEDDKAQRSRPPRPRRSARARIEFDVARHNLARK